MKKIISVVEIVAVWSYIVLAVYVIMETRQMETAFLIALAAIIYELLWVEMQFGTKSAGAESP